MMLKRPLATVLSTLLFAVPVIADSRSATPALPKKLQGVWDLWRLGSCKAPLETDTQTAIQIERDQIYQYEEIQKPVRINRISTDPFAWRIDSKSDADGYQRLETAIYVIDQYGNMTVANKNRTNVYIKCSPTGDSLENNDRPNK